MTLGFNFDNMALHLPSSHSHLHHSSHDATASIGHHHDHSHNHGNHGYSSSYPIKYEPCEGLPPTTTSSSSPTTNSSSSILGIHGTSHDDFLLHQQQISSTSTFERDFFDAIDSRLIMNGHSNMITGNGHGGESEDESDDGSSSQSSPLLESRIVSNSSMFLDKQQQRQQQLRGFGKSNPLDRKRPYPCKVCPSKFGSKMELEEHQNSHTGQKPFECEVCKSRFNRRSTLWNHKRIHSDAKPFVCTICHMQFKWKNSLKCHKEMHIRKNETPTSDDPDNDIRQLTYATAAKRKMLEMDGSDSTRTASSLTIFSASSSSGASTSSQINNNCSSIGSNSSSSESSKNNIHRKKPKLIKKESVNSIKKEPMESSDIVQNSSFPQHFPMFDSSTSGATTNNDNTQFNIFMNTPAMRKLTFGNLEFENSSHNSNNNLMSRDFGADLHLDQSNFDFINNPLWMQFWNNEGVESMNNHFGSNHQNNSIFSMDDPAKMLTNGIFDFKDTLGLHSPNGNNSNPLNMTILPKPILNIDLNSFSNSLHDSRNHSNLPAINQLATASFPDYSSSQDTSLASQFHLAQNQSNTSSSSTPSSSNGHQQQNNRQHLNSELAYQQSIDHSLLLNSNNNNNPYDHMLHLDYMNPTGNNNNHSITSYPSHDLPLSALTSSHDSLEHSPTSSRAAAMFYHDHHPGCISSQIIPTAAAAAAIQQMR